MTDILHEIKAGRLVVVPAAPEQPMLEAGEVALVDVLHGVDYFMPDDGMHRVLSAALAASPDHATALLSLVEGMACDPDGCKAHIDAFMARALAAEATCKQSLQVETIPRAANAGRYLAETNDGRLLYLNYAGEWQECPNFISRALAAEAERDALREALAAEREACAAFVEAEAKHLPGGVCDMKATCRYLANEIRARALTMETNDG